MSVRPENWAKLLHAGVRKTELAYVTSVDRETRTFFAQLCKFTNRELVEHNYEIHNYCRKITEWELAHSLRPKAVKADDICCARYDKDQSWYRVRVLTVCPNREWECIVEFVDYGNRCKLSVSDLLCPNPEELPAISSPPFGINCDLKDSDKLSSELARAMLDSLMEEYIMIRTLERRQDGVWQVDLPKVAYNSAFWISYHAAKNRLRTGTCGPLDESEIDQQLLSRAEMIAAGLGV